MTKIQKIREAIASMVVVVEIGLSEDDNHAYAVEIKTSSSTYTLAKYGPFSLFNQRNKEACSKAALQYRGIVIDTIVDKIQQNLSEDEDETGRENCDSCKYSRNCQCHLAPPQPVATTATIVAYCAIWPSVRPTDWCGQYVRRNK